MRIASTCLALLVLALAGCGDGGEEVAKPSGDPTATRALAAAQRKTLAEGTARTAVTIYDSTAGKNLVEGAGVTRLDRSEARLRVTPGEEVTAGSDVPKGTVFDMYGIDGREFVRVPKTDRWVERTDDAGTVSGLQDGLTYLGGAVDEARRVGTTTVRGEPVTRYKAVADLERVASGLPPDEEARYRERNSMANGKRFSLDVSLDRAGRIRRIALTVRVPAEGTTVRITSDYYDFGTALPKPPPLPLRDQSPPSAA